MIQTHFLKTLFLNADELFILVADEQCLLVLER